MAEMKSSNLWGKPFVFFAVLALVVLCWLFFTQSTLAACPSADLTGDCFVNFDDFALMGAQWPATDFNDIGAMANQWLTEGVPDDPRIMVWVYINDDGSGMRGLYGEPIDEGGFNGYMSKYETTNSQYCEYLNSAMNDGLITVYNDDVYAVGDISHSQVYFKPYPGYACSQITYSDSVFSVRSRDGYSMANHPVVCVSWYGATAFCNYYGYRLPTEWEWQAVADYDGSYDYGCGKTISHSKANYDQDNPLGLSLIPYTSPVDHYPSYGYGMNDMAGNAWEWISKDSGWHRVVRGGGWGENGSICTVWGWSNYDPFSAHFDLGFRVCH